MKVKISIDNFTTEEEEQILMDLISVKCSKIIQNSLYIRLVSNSGYTNDFYLKNFHLKFEYLEFEKKIIIFTQLINNFLFKLNLSINKTNKLKNNILNKFKKIIPKFFIFGSHFTKLNLPYSDTDIIINKELYKKKEIILELNKILTKILNYKDFKNKIKNSEVIRTTKIPIINIQINKLNFDISYSNYNNKGLESAYFISSYIENYPIIKNTILIFKIILLNSNLNKSFEGGLNSYGLTLLIITFFQIKMKQNMISNLNIGLFIIEFIQFFINFDYKRLYLRPILYYNNEISQFPIDKKNIPSNSFILIDPISNENNVWKLFSKFNTINVLFKSILHIILEYDQTILINIFKFCKFYKIYKNYN